MTCSRPCTDNNDGVEGSYYKVIQAHTSENDWNPEATPALFGKQGPVESYGGERVPPPQAEDAKPREASLSIALPKAKADLCAKAKLSHQLIAGAAAFEAARAYEHHKEKTSGSRLTYVIELG